MSRYRTFESGATRDTEEGKLDYAGFLSPAVLERFAQYMHKHRMRGDGSLRDSDDWKKGMPQEVYLKSLLRHTMSVWMNMSGEGHAQESMEDALCAIIFNAQGLLHARLCNNCSTTERLLREYIASQRKDGFT